MTTTPEERGGEDVGGVWLLGVYAVGWLAALVVVGVFTIVVVAGGLAVQAGLGDTTEMDALIRSVGEGASPHVPTWALALTFLLQQPVMLGLVFLAHHVVEALVYRGRVASASLARPQGWRGVLSTWPAPHWSWPASLVLGLTVGVLPGWVAEQLRQWGWGEGTLELIQRALSSGHPGWRALFVVEVTLGAALVEELVFRGFMWDALRRFGSPVVAWVGTSLLFAAYHMDMVQSSALVFTALVLGWVRWTTGSVWPCVLLHLVNNGLGVTVMLAGLGGESPSLLVALGGASLALAVCVGLGALRSRADGLASDRPLR